MSDETHNDGWTPVETGIPAPGTASTAAGFCQDCGRPLTADTVRNVGASLFCEPCLTARMVNPQPPPGDASPVLAAFLGIIPGVGAMYNGQYAKGFVHLAVSAVLFSLHDGHGVLGLVSFGWFCYQILDAYQTARARRDGTPLPNPLGLNDIGERMGFGKSWTVGVHVNRPPSSAASAPTPPPVPPYAPPPPAGYAAGWPPPRPDWVGYVPPAAFTGAPPVPPVDPAAAAAAQQAPAWGHAPYAQTYTGGVPPAAPSYSAVPPVAPPVYPAVYPTVDPLPPSRRLPVGALWLIGLGLFMLLVEFIPNWHLGGRWLLPILFAGLAAWIFTRRLQNHTLRGVCGLRWPVMLAVLAVLFALQSAEVFTLGQTWPVLFIAFGALLLLERITAPPLPVVYASGVPSAPVTTDEESARATWAASAPEPEAPRQPATEWHPDNGQKGGQ
jgi:hypothetical protein